MRRFVFRLCLALGGMTAAELLERISSRELTEWIAFYELEPFGAWQDEYRAGLISSMTANTVRDPDKRREPFEPSDFMRENFVNDLEDPEKDGQDALIKKAQAIFGLFGAKPIPRD